MRINQRLLDELVDLYDRPDEAIFDKPRRLVGIKGTRGVGKTSLLLKVMKKKYGKPGKALYVSMDNLYFVNTRLFDFADAFYTQGGEQLYLDEIHKYPNWSQELKNIYDSFPRLRVAFTSSSILDVMRGNADLSRRVILVTLKGFSLREYINITAKKKYKVLTVQDIITNHVAIASEISQQIRPVAFLKQYYKMGYYPFFLDDADHYIQRIHHIINVLTETDIPLIKNIEVIKALKLKRLLQMVAQSPPMQPNVSKLSATMEVTRATVMQYMEFLRDAELLFLLKDVKKGYDTINKPEKVFLQHPNLLYALNDYVANEGNVRETFFISQLNHKHKIDASDKGDFLLDEKYTFEIGGKSKDFKQLKDLKNAYVAADDIDVGYKNKIPLWLFGFVY